MIVYLDSSAIVKLLQREEESGALRSYLRRHQRDARASSALARVEVVRAVLQGGAAAVSSARRLLDRLHLVEVRGSVLEEAGSLAPGPSLRSLDAIHLASALAAGSQLRALVTYDDRMARAAAELGLPLAIPA